MLDGLRNRLAHRLEIFAQRLTADPRYPNAHRVPHFVRTIAGMLMTPDTAAQVSTVWACIRYLSQSVAVLPWHVMREGKNGPEIQRNHPNDYLLWKRPNPEWSSFQFRETLTHWALRWGNGYAEIERDALGRPIALWPIHPERVWVMRNPETQELYYSVANTNTSESWAVRVDVPATDMFHIRGFGEGPVGVNVMDYAAQSIGWARAAQLFGASFFGNGMNVAGVIQNKKPITPAGLKIQRAELENLYKGPNKSNKVAIIDNEATWTPVGVDPQKSQLVDVHTFLVAEVCRWFGVPPHKVQNLDRTTFNSIEQQSIEVVVDSISPWVKRFEDEGEWKLFGQNRQNLYTHIDMRGLLRGDTAARSTYYKNMVGMGAFSINRVLQLENENTIGPDGDLRVVNMTYRTPKWIAEQPVTQAAPPAPIEENSTPQDPTEDEDQEAEARLDPRVRMIESQIDDLLAAEAAHV